MPVIALLPLPSPGMSDENAPLISNNIGTSHGTFTADNPAVPPLEQSLDEDSTPTTPQRSLLAIVRVFRFSIIKTINSSPQDYSNVSWYLFGCNGLNDRRSL